MTRERLLIDVGNSRVKWVWAHDEAIDEASFGQGDIEALERACLAAIDAPSEVLMSSVAGGERTARIAALCRSRWGHAVSALESRAEQGGVRNAYADPSRLGVDRWLALVGAVAQHGKPVVVWDLGTATTLDAVDSGGQHLGGWILPGPGTMLDSLSQDTELAVPGDLGDAGSLEPGQSTAECIRRGVLAAQIGALNQFMKQVSLRMGEDPTLVATGGAAPALLPLLDFEPVHDPWLVFRGMLTDGARPDRS
jgi:type III pantothenate kinase